MNKGNATKSRGMQKLSAGWSAWRWLSGVSSKEKQWFLGTLNGARTVELPSGYSSAWVNGLGEYILSDSPSYKPNIGSNQNWQQVTTP